MATVTIKEVLEKAVNDFNTLQNNLHDLGVKYTNGSGQSVVIPATSSALVPSETLVNALAVSTASGSGASVSLSSSAVSFVSSSSYPVQATAATGVYTSSKSETKYIKAGSYSASIAGDNIPVTLSVSSSPSGAVSSTQTSYPIVIGATGTAKTMTATATGVTGYIAGGTTTATKSINISASPLTVYLKESTISSERAVTTNTATATIQPNKEIVIPAGYFGSDRIIRAAKADNVSEATAAAGFSLDITDVTATPTITKVTGGNDYEITGGLTGTFSATTAGWFSSGTATDKTITLGRIPAASLSASLSLVEPSVALDLVTGSDDDGFYVEVSKTITKGSAQPSATATTGYVESKTNSGTSTAVNVSVAAAENGTMKKYIAAATTSFAKNSITATSASTKGTVSLISTSGLTNSLYSAVTISTTKNTSDSVYSIPVNVPSKEITLSESIKYSTTAGYSTAQTNVVKSIGDSKLTTTAGDTHYINIPASSSTVSKGTVTNPAVAISHTSNMSTASSGTYYVNITAGVTEGSLGYSNGVTAGYAPAATKTGSFATTASYSGTGKVYVPTATFSKTEGTSTSTVSSNTTNGTVTVNVATPYTVNSTVAGYTPKAQLLSGNVNGTATFNIASFFTLSDDGNVLEINLS